MSSISDKLEKLAGSSAVSSFSESYGNYTDFLSSWQIALVDHDRFRYYHATHKLDNTRVASFLGGICLGLAKLVIIPVIALVGIVALPILAKMKEDSSYLFAAGFAFIRTALTAGFISLCIFYFSPVTAIALSSLIGLATIYRTYSKLNKGPEAYCRDLKATSLKERLDQLLEKQETMNQMKSMLDPTAIRNMLR